jgi:hypothetical protein
MSMRVFKGMVTLSLGLVLWFQPSLGYGGEWQEEGEAKAGVQEAAQGKDVSKEAMKAALAEMQEAMKKAAEGRAEVAQEAEVVEAQVIGNPFGFEPEKMKAAKRFQLSQAFQVEIELIERLCEPTPQQLAKLRVGSKGAVKKLGDQWWKKSGQRFGGMAMEMKDRDNDQDSEQQSEEETTENEVTVDIKDANEIDDNLAQMVLMNAMGNPLQAVSPAEEKTWKALVAGILTAEQSANLATYQTAQADERRQEMLQSIVGMLGRELKLPTETKQKLHATLKPHFENAEIRCIAFFEPYMGYYLAAKATNEELAEFLSPAQIQSMRMLLWPARQIEQMMGREE